MIRSGGIVRSRYRRSGGADSGWIGPEPADRSGPCRMTRIGMTNVMFFLL